MNEESELILSEIADEEDINKNDGVAGISLGFYCY